MQRENVYFILVRPNFLGNIGSAARVLRNFGFKHLRLVSPPKNYKDAEARKMAVGAFDVLKNSVVFESFTEALKDINVAIGTTCGHQRKNRLVPLDRISECFASADDTRLAIVFGDERDGLLKEELEQCHYMMAVPTDPEFPSLNLSMAVGILAFELSRLFESVRPDDGGEELPCGADDDEFFVDVDKLLFEADFTREYNRQPIVGELRSLFKRARPTKRELELLQGALYKIRKNQT